MNARVLVVDDDFAIRSTLQSVLQTKGFTVATADSAADACRLLAAQTFDLVLTDMKMETQLSGYEVIRVARQQPYQPATIIITAFPLLAQQWREAGADAVLRKPAHVQEILGVIEHLVQVRAHK